MRSIGIYDSKLNTFGLLKGWLEKRSRSNMLTWDCDGHFSLLPDIILFFIFWDKTSMYEYKATTFCY